MNLLLSTKCEQANQRRDEVKFTALISSAATPPTEFNDPSGACVIDVAAWRPGHGCGWRASTYLNPTRSGPRKVVGVMIAGLILNPPCRQSAYNNAILRLWRIGPGIVI
jgi:hypothetical protein